MTAIMSKHCAIQEFLDLSVGLVVSLHTHRYGGGIIAMICPSDKVEDFVDSIEDNNGEMEWELWGLRESWYPIVEGTGVNDALNRLRAKLVAEKVDWATIITGISILPEFPRVHVKRVKCKVVTMSELHHVIAIWSQGEPVTDLF
jgi:hypothetical protein